MAAFSLPFICVNASLALSVCPKLLISAYKSISQIGLGFTLPYGHILRYWVSVSTHERGGGHIVYIIGTMGHSTERAWGGQSKTWAQVLTLFLSLWALRKITELFRSAVF